MVVFVANFIGRACAAIHPSGNSLTPSAITESKLASIPTQTRFSAKISTPVVGVTKTTTVVPLGVFVLLIYPPLFMNYDVAVWEDESQYAEVSHKPVYSILNYLQSRGLETCQIGIQGPTGDFPFTPEAVQLDSVRYEVITFTDSPPGFTAAYYIENSSLKGFSYKTGSPVLVLQASLVEWKECKTSAEKVLSTLRVP